MARIALIGDNSVEYINALIDIWNSGDCAVLIDWRIPFKTSYQMMLEANVTKCYIDECILEKIDVCNNNAIEFISFNVASRSPRLLPYEIYSRYHNNTSLNEAVILYSSGTTGRSKGIILSHFALSTNADAILDYMKINKNDCLFMVKSLSHSSTLTGELLTSLRSESKVVISPTVVPPRFVLSRIEEFGVTTLCLNPTLLQMYANEYQQKHYNISTLRTIYTYGAQLNNQTYQKVNEVFAGIEIFNGYGLSEAGPRVTSQRKTCCNGNSAGKPIKNVEIVIVDDDGNPVRAEERGIIHVNTPSRFNGYVMGNEKHQSLYNGWLNTGDIGFIDKFGELRIVDRLDDVIINNAHKIYPSDIERLLIENTDISECAVTKCAIKGEEIIGCLYVGKTEVTTDTIRELGKVLLPYEVPKRYIKVSSLPKNERGKISKKEIERILSNE